MDRRTRKPRSSGKPYCKWSEEEKLKLLKIRIELDHIFTSKNANINEGWRLVAERFGDPQKDYKSCRQAWKNIAQKYKAVGIQHTGDGAGDDAPSTQDEFEESPVFALFKKYAEKKHNYHPPYVLESSAGAVSLALPSPEYTGESDQTPSPSFSSSTLFTYPSSASPTTSPSPVPSSSRYCKGKLTAYEQYCVKRDTKLTKKMSSMMAVFGQMVAKDYPDIDVDKLTKKMSSMMAVFGQMVAKDYPDIDVDKLLVTSSSDEE